jgi:quercetin dioxygenase-like cupin family protein
MNKPISPEAGISFDLVKVAKGLRRRAQYEREGRASQTLIRTADLRVVLVVLRGEGGLAEHQTNVTASIHNVQGELRIELPHRTVHLPAGQILILAAGLSHRVYAEKESTFLLTLGWPGTP